MEQGWYHQPAGSISSGINLSQFPQHQFAPLVSCPGNRRSLPRCPRDAGSRPAMAPQNAVKGGQENASHSYGVSAPKSKSQAGQVRCSGRPSPRARLAPPMPPERAALTIAAGTAGEFLPQPGLLAAGTAAPAPARGEFELRMPCVV